MARRVVIHLFIDQSVPDGEAGEQMVHDYIDELAKTDGLLTWNEVDWDTYALDSTDIEERDV